MNRHAHFICIDVNETLSAQNRQDLWQNGLAKIGRADASPDTSKRMQVRVRLDNRAVIFEAEFDDNDLSVAALKNRLGTLFDINPNLIVDNWFLNDALGALSWTELLRPTSILRLTYLTHSIAIAIFGAYLDGGMQYPNKKQSADEADAFIIANSEQWNADEGQVV